MLFRVLVAATWCGVVGNGGGDGGGGNGGGNANGRAGYDDDSEARRQGFSPGTPVSCPPSSV